ncbi:MATE family efflux transporter [Crateriforma conspicua]|uniref:MATE family efflux transporter n=1 Tax=Crateriforma conspicua TaxID=2527996 RepID=UPI00118ABB46|nr:MATE family efflux transporter [Crateriforma conspicua]QDV62708.1 Multidrug resistance protein MdtK [Crateriforma conspicua]
MLRDERRTANQRKPERRESSEFGYAALLKVAVPLAATVGCFSITLFTDRTLLMWYEPTSSAASVAAGNLYWAVACIPVSAMGYVTPLVALQMGRRDRRLANIRIWSLIWQCIWMAAASVPVFSLIGWASPILFQAFDHEPALAKAEAGYFRILLWIAPASMLEAGLTAFFVGRRITRPILRMNLFSAVVNVGLDVWLIFGGLGVPAMGVRGAALATVLAMWLKVSGFALLMTRLRSFARYRADAWKPDLSVAAKIVGPGSALGVQQLIRSALFSFILLVIGAASVDGLAATSATLSLYQLLSIPVIGLATAVTVVTGQAFAGHGRDVASHVIRRGLVLGLITAGIISMLLLFATDPLLQIPLRGVDGDRRDQIHKIANVLMVYAAIYGIADIIGLLLGAAAKGLGRTTIILAATAGSGIAVVGSAWWIRPHDETAVSFWWSALVIWAVIQAGWIELHLHRLQIDNFPTTGRSGHSRPTG